MRFCLSLLFASMVIGCVSGPDHDPVTKPAMISGTLVHNSTVQGGTEIMVVKDVGDEPATYLISDETGAFELSLTPGAYKLYFSKHAEDGFYGGMHTVHVSGARQELGMVELSHFTAHDTEELYTRTTGNEDEADHTAQFSTHEAALWAGCYTDCIGYFKLACCSVKGKSGKPLPFMHTCFPYWACK